MPPMPANRLPNVGISLCRTTGGGDERLHLANPDEGPRADPGRPDPAGRDQPLDRPPGHAQPLGDLGHREEVVRLQSNVQMMCWTSA